MSEGYVVYYKDDMTKFSEKLNLNKIRRKRRKMKPLSDMEYLNDSEGSLNDPPFKTALSEVE